MLKTKKLTKPSVGEDVQLLKSFYFAPRREVVAGRLPGAVNVLSLHMGTDSTNAFTFLKVAKLYTSDFCTL